MTSWTGQAHLLADAIREPGFNAAGACAAAWRARVIPAATNGLVGAAMALTDGEAMGALWAQVPPCPRDQVMLEQAAELEGAVSDLLGQARRLAQACREAHEEACSAAASARSAASTAGTPQARADAENRLEESRAVIADCEAALEIIDGAGKRLAYALKCLRHVPDDYATAYEVPLAHVRINGPLPKDGDFVTDSSGILKIEAA